MSNQFFADLELSMQPKREATDKVVKAARIFLDLNERELNWNTHSPKHKAALKALNTTLDELEEVEHPTHFCTVLKPIPMGSTNYWRKHFPSVDHPELCGRPAFFNNHTRCPEHKES